MASLLVSIRHRRPYHLRSLSFAQHYSPRDLAACQQSDYTILAFLGASASVNLTTFVASLLLSIRPLLLQLYLSLDRGLTEWLECLRCLSDFGLYGRSV